jgi:hypothetical protein
MHRELGDIQGDSGQIQEIWDGRYSEIWKC